jgi:hypothetical protein
MSPIPILNQLASYESNPNPLYYATHFVDGLRDDIKAVVMIQRPSTLDYVCALALVQEEALDTDKKKEYKRYEPVSNRHVHKSAYPLPVPPKLDRHVQSPAADDKRATEAAQANTSDEKLRALRQYRRARGLCDKCAEKWSYGHKCANTV